MSIALYKTPHGTSYKCGTCPCIHLEFNNIILKMSEKNFESFKKFIFSVNGRECEYAHRDTHHKRKILLEMQPTGIRLAFFRHELAELRLLLEATEGMLRLIELGHSVEYSLN